MTFAPEPAARLRMYEPGGDLDGEEWVPVPDLLDSHAFDRHFVVEVDDEGVASARFGDGEYGRRPAGAARVTAEYRVGNGPSGNVGHGSIVHVTQPPSTTNAVITSVYQPLPAAGGAAAESIESVRQRAPHAFKAELKRAVTERDYEAVALRVPGVGAAKCAFRWTGSWHSVFVAVHPRDPVDLVTLAGGRTRLADELDRSVRRALAQARLAGYDLEVRTAQYVPLEVTIRVCVAPGHFRADVLREVSDSLLRRDTGFFALGRFAFGQFVYLSQLYAAVEAIPGVESCDVVVFKRYWEMAGSELDDGQLVIGPGEIARLDNDINFPENGVLTLTAAGGA
jgi:predicted phage baseplate assembly protein